MKYCQKCGKELFDEAVICPGCGCPVNSTDKIDPALENPYKIENSNIFVKKGLIKALSIAGAALAILGFAVFMFVHSVVGITLAVLGIISAIIGNSFITSDVKAAKLHNISAKDITSKNNVCIISRICCIICGVVLIAMGILTSTYIGSGPATHRSKVFRELLQHGIIK